MPTKHTAALSFPKTKTVRGYEIKRLPLGGYLQAVQILQDLPGDLLSACFPDQSLGETLGQLKKVDETLLQSMIGNILLAAPKHAVSLAAQLTGIDEQELLENPDVGLDGLVEILNAWMEVNRIGDFLPAVRELIGKLRAATVISPQPNTGSNG